MSALDSFVIWTWNAIWNLLLLLLLLIVLIVPVLRLIVVVLVHSVHVILHIVSVVAAAVAAHVLSTTAPEALEATLILHATPAILLWTASRPWSFFSHLLVFTRRLIAVLILNALLCQYELFRSELVSWLAQLLVAVSKVALLLEEAVLMRFIMPAPLGLVLLVQLFHFLLIWCLLSIIHDHLTGHQVLLRVLLIIWHHTHHLWVIEHLIRHLSILLLHLLHAHAHVVHVTHVVHVVHVIHVIHVVHVARHARHLIRCLLHLSCSVHIHYINY
jgi:hypothetical protein